VARQDLAGDKNVSCPQERVQGFEDVVNRAVIQVAFMLSEELHVSEKLGTINLVKEPKEKCEWDNWAADHIKPWSKGGKTTVENGQVSCVACTSVKKDSVQAAAVSA
jgi:hypothetical protein